MLRASCHLSPRAPGAARPQPLRRPIEQHRLDRDTEQSRDTTADLLAQAPLPREPVGKDWVVRPREPRQLTLRANAGSSHAIDGGVHDRGHR